MKYSWKVEFVCVIIGIMLLAVACRKAEENKPVEKLFDEKTSADLVFFYRKDSTYEQRTYFHENVLNKQLSGNRGYWPRDGVKLTYAVDNKGYEGSAINFESSATPEQRDEVKRVISESPIVLRVYENRVPETITDLP
jgi:hypothetical protein